MSEDKKMKIKKGTIKIWAGIILAINLIWGGSAIATIGLEGPLLWAMSGTGGIVMLCALYLILDGLSSTD